MRSFIPHHQIPWFQTSSVVKNTQSCLVVVRREQYTDDQKKKTSSRSAKLESSRALTWLRPHPMHVPCRKLSSTIFEIFVFSFSFEISFSSEIRYMYSPWWRQDIFLVPDLPGGVGTQVSVGDVGGEHLGGALDVDGDEEGADGAPHLGKFCHLHMVSGVGNLLIQFLQAKKNSKVSARWTFCIFFGGLVLLCSQVFTQAWEQIEGNGRRVRWVSRGGGGAGCDCGKRGRVGMQGVGSIHTSCKVIQTIQINSIKMSISLCAMFVVHTSHPILASVGDTHSKTDKPLPRPTGRRRK